MKKFIQQKLKDQKGMTLIELLAVIVIIAIIAAIAIPAIGNIIENSRVGAVKSDALNIIAAAELYYADNPTVTTDVTIVTLASGYLEDEASFNADTAAYVTPEGLIDGIGIVGGVTLTFQEADREAVSSLANNSAVGVATTVGTGSVTVTAR